MCWKRLSRDVDRSNAVPIAGICVAVPASRGDGLLPRRWLGGGTPICSHCGLAVLLRLVGCAVHSAAVGPIGATWLLALVHERTGRNAWLVAGIVLNLASLATFKYLDFMIGSLEAAIGIALPRANLMLPIGISFFSFQLISYCVDRIRKDAPIYPFRPFALFVLLFPH